jgi:hypothetical protein
LNHARSFFIALLLLIPAQAALAGNASAPLGDPVQEPPTLRSLGVYWAIQGDDNQNAVVEFSYRKTGTTDWHQGAPLFRVERRTKPYLDESGEPKPPSKVQIPADGWLFAGSLLMLDPDTAYDLKLKLKDPDGGDVEKLFAGRTIGEPVAPANAPTFHVVPGKGGGSGTAADPFKGLVAAQKSAKPGDIFLVHAGVYPGTFHIERNGESGKPIVWRGAGDGDAILDGLHPIEKLAGATIEASDSHDVWFEHLSICNSWNLIRAHETARMVVRRCHFYNGYYGVVAEKDDTSHLSNFFISDNFFEGFMPWPVTQQQWHDLPEARAVFITGAGHEVCYNRITHWKDGLDTGDGPICCAIDFHNNDVSEMFDDGCEMDGSERNTRNYCNRYCNTLTGVSLQPVYGGPIYVYRNVIFNCLTEGFKLHNSPSGALLIHNTIVKNGTLLDLSTEEEVIHCISRNNLILGTSGRALNYEPPMIHCDFDYDGFGGFSGPVFIKWNGERYATPAEVRAKSPIEKHLVIVDPATAFASGIVPPGKPRTIVDHTTVDVRLKPGSAAIDAGEILPGFSDGFAGKGPDLGAYELGAPLEHYGPREEAKH